MESLIANPKMLLLLWLVTGVGIWWYAAGRSRDRKLEKLISPLMLKKLRPPFSFLRFAWQVALIILGLLLCVIAAARPQWGEREETVYQRGRDLVIALDVSRSMLANDVHPNRLQRAKADIMDLIKELRGDRAALLAFRRKAILLCPLTTDYAYLRQALDAVVVDSAPRGETDIGDAIHKAMEAFESDGGSHKAIVLISDGEDLKGNAIAAARQASERGIPIFTVGLGKREGSRIPDEKESRSFARHKGEDIVTRLDNETLYEIAGETGGVYVPVGTASMTSITLGTLYRDHLRRITTQDLEETLQRKYVERFQIFLLPGIICILCGAFLSRGRLGARAPQRGESHGSGVEVVEQSVARPVKDITPPQRELRQV